MKPTLFALLSSLFLLAGCASSGPEKSIKYQVPKFDYEQHEPEFTPYPPKQPPLPPDAVPRVRIPPQ